MGTVVSVLREKVDEYREKGIKIGMLKIRVFRPFPEDEVREALSSAGKVLVFDRACSPGSTYGVSCIEVRSALQKSQADISNIIISGREISLQDVDDIFENWLNREDEFVVWHKADFDERVATMAGYDNYEKLVSGQSVTRELVEEGGACLSKGMMSCAGCVSLGAIRTVLDVFGKRAVVVNNAGCLSAVGAFYPMTAWRVPFYFYTYSNAGAATSGMEVAMKRKGIDADIVLIAGDGALFDIGLQTFSAALERGHRVVYVCYDNEAYMNTGVQRSGSTPLLAKTKTTIEGSKIRAKNIEQIVAAHGDVYIATASPAFHDDFVKKIKKAKELNKPAFIHVICPCPPGWEHDPAIGIEIARLAVETGTVVLYEYENGKITINKVPKKMKPVKEYLMKQGRFSHLTEAQIAQIQEEVDRNFARLTEQKLS
jgi:pyruvate ferredoxin oxidoreductase beta subunit